jgi:rare lipoprotein A
MRRLSLIPVLLVAIGIALSGCSSKHSSKKLDPFAGTGSPYYKGHGKIPKGGGRYHVGKPYQVAGRWFRPHEQPNYDAKGPASWYGEAFHRRKTSNGEWFDMNELTAAHPTLPLPSYVKVTNLENGRSVVVRVNDRGPFVGPRIMDLSKRAAEVLGYQRQGTTRIRAQFIGPAPLNDKGRHLAAMNRELVRGTPLKRMIAAANGNMGRSDDVQFAAAPAPAMPEPVVAGVQTAAASPPAAHALSVPQAGAGEDYYVQVGTFAAMENAERLRGQLGSVWPVQVVELNGTQGTIYRVRLGPLDNEDDAKTALEEAVALGHPDARLIVAQSMQASLR